MSGRKDGKSASKMIAWCVDCESDQGVVFDRFNRAGLPDIWRFTVHTNKLTGSKCLGSRSVIAEVAVVPNDLKVAQ